MNMKGLLVRKWTVLVATLVLAFGVVGSAQAGKIYISGQDSDDSGHVTQAFGGQILDFIGIGNTNGGSGILILGGNVTGTSNTTINSWNAVANSGSGFTLTRASGAAAIAAQSFAGFAAILIPSDSGNTGGGISQLELNAINARALDIATFVNGGGDLGAFTEGGLTGAFGWFPLGALTIVNQSYNAAAQTPALLAAGFIASNADISGDLYHNVFTGPPGFFGLSVLATNNQVGTSTFGQAAILGGGAQTQITIPEPSSLMLLAAGIIGLGWGIRRRSRRVGTRVSIASGVRTPSA